MNRKLRIPALIIMIMLSGTGCIYYFILVSNAEKNENQARAYFLENMTAIQNDYQKDIVRSSLYLEIAIEERGNKPEELEFQQQWKKVLKFLEPSFDRVSRNYRQLDDVLINTKYLEISGNYSFNQLLEKMKSYGDLDTTNKYEMDKAVFNLMSLKKELSIRYVGMLGTSSFCFNTPKAELILNQRKLCVSDTLKPQLFWINRQECGFYPLTTIANDKGHIKRVYGGYEVEIPPSDHHLGKNDWEVAVTVYQYYYDTTFTVSSSFEVVP